MSLCVLKEKPILILLIVTFYKAPSKKQSLNKTILLQQTQIIKF
jgi:hypothetical protein